MSKVDLTKPYGTVYGSTDGSRYEQDGKIYNTQGELMSSDKTAKGSVNGEVKVQDASADDAAAGELDALKVEAKALGIKSPHLFKPEALALKVEEAKLAALSKG